MAARKAQRRSAPSSSQSAAAPQPAQAGSDSGERERGGSGGSDSGVRRGNLGQRESYYHSKDLCPQDGVLSPRLSSRVTSALKRGVSQTGGAEARAGYRLESESLEMCPGTRIEDSGSGGWRLLADEDVPLRTGREIHPLSWHISMWCARAGHPLQCTYRNRKSGPCDRVQTGYRSDFRF
jgi:hypothetical protein